MTPSTPPDPTDAGDSATSGASSSSPDKRKLDKTNRARWATRKLTVKSSQLKRLSLVGRNHHNQNGKSDHSEKKRQSGGSETIQSSAVGEPEPQDAANENVNEEEETHAVPRQLYFNLPVPQELLDEDGKPIQQFTRNKIRTAKYTPLSFVPKNLWFQFQNVANVFFLFLVIIVCFPIFGGTNPGLSAVPLICIVVITAVKDAIEDYRRTILDIDLNNAAVHRLQGWNNPNVLEDNVSTWRKTKKATSKFFGMLWHTIERMWKKEDEATRKRRSGVYDDDDDRRMSVETRVTRGASTRQSFRSAVEDIQMTPVTSPLPTQQTHNQVDAPPARTSFEFRDPEAEARFQNIQGDVINHDLDAPGQARFHKDAWKNLQVGDFVRIYGDDELPADIIVLSTSDPDGACYVETKNLDGETNLKVRQALRCGRGMKHARDCERAQFMIDSEPPQANLYKYNGAIKWEQNVNGMPREMSEPVTIDNVLLRGCNVRNTEWVLGVVLFTGHDTKIMMNAGVTPSKRARIARGLNFNVICNFVFLFFMCFVAAIVNGVAWGRDDSSLAYFDFGSIGSTPSMTGFITFWAALIVFQNLIPISLYISLEIVRTLQAVFIYSDVEMYYEPIDQPCVPKSWNISDDLGQVEYIFSDKTGTLTQNVMEFKKATINGQPYGEAYTEAQAGMQKRAGIDVEKEGTRIRAEIEVAKTKALQGLRDVHDNPFLHDDEMTFIAPDFVDDLAGMHGDEQREANAEFMLALALCHTVIAEKQPGDPPKMIFKAQSPDEAALVATARDMGFTVLGHTGDGINVNVMGEDKHFPILNTIEFNSSRKRMSAIVRLPDGKIVLYCKGADSVIYARLKRGEQPELRRETAEHLELFAREGLRTLCIAKRYLNEQEYIAWQKEHQAAATALEDREEKLEAVADLIEQDLTLIGGTAIEDRLQDGVPDTIALLAEGGIKLWVLTGDKVETAINIGFSCNLLSNEMEMIRLQAMEDESGQTSADQYVKEIEASLDKYLQVFGMTGSDEDLHAARQEHKAPPPTHALVIDGFTLRWVLDERIKQKFLLLCKNCKSVLCCRVSPAQKAAVVSMVKNGLDVMTLSIGDGANDVAMIQEADVGVGIAGEEGRQAVMSSDYAIGQFRFLQRLVLVHGRWSYRRLAETISNFFYKNIVWTFSIFWYQVYCDFDITYIFEYSYIIMFNLFFTSVPVILMGVLDQDVSDSVSLAVPQLYRRGIERLEWTQKKFWLYMLDGLYQSVMVFYIPYLTVVNSPFPSFSGLDVSERYRLGCYIAHPAVITINLYILINTYRWDWVMLLVVVLSDLFIFFWTGVYTAGTYSATFYGAAAQVYSEATFWACYFIVPVLCIFPRFAIKALQKVYFPYDVDIVREQVTMGRFANIEKPDQESAHEDSSESSASSKNSSKKSKHVKYESVDEDRRPIYPPSVVTQHTRAQNGSDGTNYTGHEHDMAARPVSTNLSEPDPYPVRQSIDRARPSYDRIRASMDRIRPSFEQSNDFTSAARLSRMESSHSTQRLPSNSNTNGLMNRTRLRGLSIISAKSKHNNQP